MTPDSALHAYLIQHSACGNVLKRCKLYTEEKEIIIDCPTYADARFLSYNAGELAEITRNLTNSEGFVIELEGDELDYIPLISKTSLNMLASPTKQISAYPELLDIVRYSDYPTYVTLLPVDWEWEMPIKCVLTSDKVFQFAQRTPLDFHGADISLLYDKSDLEKQIGITMREFERNNSNPTKIVDLEYTTYLSDPSRKTPQKDPCRRYEYVADFEIQFIKGIGLVRICHCKERRPSFRY